MAAGDGGKALGVSVSNPALDGIKVTDGTGTGTTTANKVIEAGGGTSTLAFYGVTAVVQPTSSNEAAPASTAPVSVSATQWGFSTSTQAQAILTLVTQLRADLVTLGLIKGS